jgi:hypothetical protein
LILKELLVTARLLASDMSAFLNQKVLSDAESDSIANAENLLAEYGVR